MDLVQNREGGNLITLLQANLAFSMDGAISELRVARERLEGVPDDFAWAEFSERLATAEAAARGGRAGRRGQEGERRACPAALARSDAAVLHHGAQEELAQMKGLMFAADEIKRQFGELEERYQGLEVEYTEKAEQEIVMRAARSALRMRS